MQTFQINKNSVAFEIVEDEAVVIHTDTSDYFGLNLTGTYLWSQMTERSCHKDELIQHISSSYKLTLEVAQEDIDSFLDKLTKAQLIVMESDHEPSVSKTHSDSNVTASDPYEPPDLVKFGDLETLILSGE